MLKLTHVDANNILHLTYVYTSIRSHETAPSSLSNAMYSHYNITAFVCNLYNLFPKYDNKFSKQ